jgi:hypothetical protein
MPALRSIPVAATAAAMAVALASACDGRLPIEDDGAPGAGGGATNGAGATTSGVTTGGATTSEWVLSVVPEHDAGQAPAWLTLANDSDAIVTAVLGGASFEQLAPDDPVEPKLAVSANVQDDATIGYHASKDPLDPCFFLKVVVGGATALAPGAAYTFRVYGQGDQLNGEVLDEGSAAPFVALRGWQTVEQLGASELEVTLAGEATARSFDVSTWQPTPYQPIAATSVSLDRVSFQAPDGSRYEHGGPIAITGAIGFTLVVGAAADEHAVDSVTLQPVP